MAAFNAAFRRFLLGSVCHKAMIVRLAGGYDPRRFVVDRTPQPNETADAA